MTEIFRNHDSVTVGLVQSMLEGKGIPTLIRNDSTSRSSVAVSDSTPTLCVVDDAQEELAISSIREHFEAHQAKAGEEKGCGSCGEKSPSNFGSCWNCSADFT